MPKMILEYKKAVISKIIQTALDIFSKNGYRGTTMGDIAKELGVSKGALYSYFKSKDDILKEIFQSNHQILREILCKSLDSQDYVQTMEKAYKLMTEKYHEFIHTSFEIFALASHDKDMRKIVREDHEKDVEVIREFVQNLMEKGSIRTDADPRIMAQLIDALFTGIWVNLIMGYDNAEVHETWMRSISVVLGKH
ncbi:MAG: TetR/AcrR family transcriptional regulator [Candidatus Bathyarchaeia archaeon]|jgi:AcrR family transcriptional regulator